MKNVSDAQIILRNAGYSVDRRYVAAANGKGGYVLRVQFNSGTIDLAIINGWVDDTKVEKLLKGAKK